MRARPSRLRSRDLALFAVVASLVAITVVLVGGEAGVDDQVEAGTESSAATQQAAPQQTKTRRSR